MAVTKDSCTEQVEIVRSKGLEIAASIIEANKAPNNEQQIEALRIALEMYKAFAVKA